MSVTCPNCGLSNEDDSKFCSQCGFQLPAVDSRAPSEFIPPTPSVAPRSSPQRSSPEKVVFVSKGASRHRNYHSRRSSRSHRRQHSGWLMGVVFLGIGFLFVVFLLVPLFFGISYNSVTDWSDFGTSMGHMGSDLGEFFGNFGERMGDFFGGLGDRIGDSFDHGFSFNFLPVFFLSLFPLLFLVIGVVVILRSVRVNRQSL